MRATAFTAFLCLLLLTGCAHARDGWVELSGKRYTVELATNDAQRERGLMFRSRMDPSLLRVATTRKPRGSQFSA